MAKITWDDRSNTGENSKISASIFNDIKNSVNAIYEDDVSLSGSIFISGNIIPNADDSLTSSFDLGSATNAWKDIYVSDGSIKFVKSGESTVAFTKEEVSKLQSGKSISKTVGKQLVNENDDTTYVRMSTAGRAVHYAGGNAAIDIKSDKVTLGGLDGASTGLPISVPGGITGGADITGSVNTTGSTTQTGSMSILPPPTVITGYVTASTIYNGYDIQTQDTTPDYGTVSFLTASGWTGSVFDPNGIGSIIFSTASYLTQWGGGEFDAANLHLSYSQQNLGSIKYSQIPTWFANEFVFSVNSINTSSVYTTGYVTYDVSFSYSHSYDPTYDDEPLMEYTGGGGAGGRFTLTSPPDSIEGGVQVGDLLELLANYGQTGMDVGQLGDYNYDGAVTSADLMLALGGYGNPNVLTGVQYYPPNGNFQLIGPEISVQGALLISTGSVLQITT